MGHIIFFLSSPYFYEILTPNIENFRIIRHNLTNPFTERGEDEAIFPIIPLNLCFFIPRPFHFFHCRAIKEAPFLSAYNTERRAVEQYGLFDCHSGRRSVVRHL